MPYFRRPKDHEHPYAQISNQMLEEDELSFKAKGLLAYLLAQSDEWEIYQSQLAEIGPDGKTAVRSGIEELMEAGYLVRNKLREEDGTFKGYEYVIYENGRAPDSKDQNSEIGNPEIGGSEIGDPATNNTNGQQDERQQNDTRSDADSDESVADATESRFVQLCAETEDITGGDSPSSDTTDIQVHEKGPDRTREDPPDAEQGRGVIPRKIEEIRAADAGDKGWILGTLFRELFAPWWDDDQLRQNLGRLIREAKRLRGERGPEKIPISEEESYVQCAKALEYLYFERDDLHGREVEGARKDQPIAALNVLSKHISLKVKDDTQDEDDGEVCPTVEALPDHETQEVCPTVKALREA